MLGDRQKHLGVTEVHADRQTVADLFTRAPALMRIVERDLPVVRPLMQGHLDVAWSTGRAIPPAAKRYFEGIDSNKNELKDVPVSYVIHVQEEVRELLLREEEAEAGVDGRPGSGARLAGNLAAVLEKWSVLSVDLW
ncbi:hypothetical protein B0H67DRAFT_119706 [Lasiosphaeris hirsuta]|uniref:Uncharacterized protein n=1 Tax=Lasiosphaeris hirsuta TaxID=260670 RepID=A0AA40AZR7_9PEZI|nr:hypothetical protein B0H67DRAFT_119706 [Lasiosphaeris hirsuta]